MTWNRASATVVLIDLVGSTLAVTERGMRQVGPEVAERLHGLVAEFQQADLTIRQVGEFAFDGVLLVGADPAAAIRCAVRSQAVYVGLPARIVVAVGPVELVEGAGAQGTVINLADRLLDMCVPGGVVLTEAAMEYVQDHPHLRARMVRRRSEAKGFGTVWHWALNGRRADELVRRVMWLLLAGEVLLAMAVGWVGMLHLRLPRPAAAVFEYDLPQVFADEQGRQPVARVLPGSAVYVRRRFCATDAGHLVVHRFLLDGAMHTYEEREVSVARGCQTVLLRVPLPPTLAPGAWTYRVVAGFRGAELRTMTDVQLVVGAR